MQNSNVACPAHPDYFITNICTFSSCIEPLCPECIVAHIKQHSQKGQTPNIENIQNVRVQQKAHAFEILQKLNEKNFILNSNNQQYIQSGIEKLQIAKSDLIHHIEEYFTNLETEFKKSFENIQIKQDPSANEALNSEIKKFTALYNDFGTTEYVKATLYCLDKGLIQMKTSIDKDISDLMYNLPDISIIKKNLQYIQQSLEQYISIKKQRRNVQFNDEKEVVRQLVGEPPKFSNNVYLETGFKVPKFADNSSELREIQQISNQPIQISRPKQDLQLLVAFYEDQKTVMYYTLPNYMQNQNQPAVEIQLEIERRIPVGHQCVVFQKDIFLIGGIEKDSNRNESISTVYRLNLNSKTLMHHSNMVHRRQGFGACSSSKGIYVCGGSFTNLEDSSVNSLEFWGGVRWTPLKNCRYACTGCSLTCINDLYLIKLGGIDSEFNEVKHTEIYDIRQNLWFDLQIFDQARGFYALAYNFAIQVNESQIFVMGGESDQSYVDNCWLITLDINHIESAASVRKVQSLPYAGPVQGACVQENLIYAVMNRVENPLLRSKKHLVTCDSEKWNYIQNINDAKWTVTEKYQQNNKADYKDSIQQVCSIESVEELAYLCKKTIYTKLTELFSEQGKNRIFNALHNQSDVTIEAIEVFKNDIKPLWEDPKNKNGCEVRFEVAYDFHPIYNAMYTDILFEIIGQSTEDLQHINGVRVLDKINSSYHGSQPHIRFEIWYDFRNKDQQHEALLKRMEEFFIGLAHKYNLKEISFKYIPHDK